MSESPESNDFSYDETFLNHGCVRRSRSYKKQRKLAYDANPIVAAFEDDTDYNLPITIDGDKTDKAYKTLFSCQIYMDALKPIPDYDPAIQFPSKRFYLLVAKDFLSCMLVVKKGKDVYGFTGTFEQEFLNESLYLNRRVSHFIYSIKSDQLSWLSSNSIKEKWIKFDVILKSDLVIDCSLDDQPFNSQNCSVLSVMSQIYKQPLVYLNNNYSEPRLNIIEKILDQVREYHDQEESSIDLIQPKKLYPTLRNYQKKAVQWMLKRENWKTKPDSKLNNEPHPLWTYIESLDLQYNFYGGFFRSSKERMVLSPTALGGILADEMGLGKTVEILALLLSHPRPDATIIAPVIKQSETKTNGKRYLCRCDFRKKDENKTSITCVRCKSVQHKECINYNSEKWSHLPYYCSNCWDEPAMSKLKSRATFIITPNSIYHQWKEEISKHIDINSLNVLEYTGVSSRYIYPYELADNDIVLASYETLASELRYVGLPKEDRFRHPKRFISPGTPLMAINWWRVVLDEAQMVESVSSHAAIMAGNLSSVNHWCVTGTPIQKSVNDIFGLILFIGEKPYSSRLWWKLLIADPYCKLDFAPLTNLLKECFWRNTKKDVFRELGLPDRTEHIVQVNFAPIEKHFYTRQKEKCLRAFAEDVANLDDLNIALKQMDNKYSTSLMNPLLKLRQSCCHPQIAGVQIMTMSKKTMTMEEVLDTMIQRNSYECEEDHRKIIAALNGQAGIHIIKNDFLKAIEIYRSVLRSIENFKDKFRTDKLQLFHTLYNLADILETIKATQEGEKVSFGDKLSMDQIGYTLRDDNLKNEADSLRDEYLAAGSNTIKEAKDQLKSIMDNTSSQVSIITSDWWIQALGIIIKKDEEATLMNKIRDGLEEHALRNLVKQGKFYRYLTKKDRNISGLEFIIATGLDEFQMTREKLVNSVLAMKSKPATKKFNEAIDCHLRPRRDDEGNIVPGRKCSYCLIQEDFNNYEDKLYFFIEKEKISRKRRLDSYLSDDDEESDLPVKTSPNILEEQRRGNWSAGELEQILKILLNLVSKQSRSGEVQEKGKQVLELFEQLKKEFRALRSVWISIFDYVSRLDELNMATIRLRQLYPDEPKPDESITYILEAHEIDLTLMQLQADEKISRADLQRNLSHLNYLTNLKKSNVCKEGSLNPDPCPICTNLLGVNWSSFNCGHSYCLSCCNTMIDNSINGLDRSKSIKCPICRQFTRICDILHVATEQMQVDEEKISVKGSWSSKVEEIIRTLIRIRSKEPDAKCLLFSTWTSFLMLIGRALVENGIDYILADQSRKFTRLVEKFKVNSIPVLLMPIHLGSKGLNLVEANHALLVEPLLDPSHEYQAIGRIHRIGQTKPTHVYRFIVNQTIEEKINAMFSLARNYNEFSNLNDNQKVCKTVKDIYDLLLSDGPERLNIDD